MPSYEKRTWWTRHDMSRRLADETFLEAAVTCAFAVAAADGSASEVEYDALLDRLELLGGVERDTIDGLVSNASHRLEEDGFAPLIARVAELVGDPGQAEAALMLGLVIGLADDEYTSTEQEIVTQLATATGVAPARVDEMVAELRA
ncbi:MAG: tellurite resistance TerB family protein [Deltaproteobacteria bacterium]|nr:tellurite resistance TerB family protein [Kofleriaceae bacterium]